MTVRQGTLWIATEIYYPEKTSTGYLLTRLAEGLASSGPVGVLCAQPSYEQRGLRAPPRENVNGVGIVRVRHPGFDRAKILGRLLNVIVVTLRMFVRALRELRRGDVSIVVTNPPLLPIAIYAAAALRRVPVVLLVHDVYPEAAILAGVLRENGILARIWAIANGWLFRRVDSIVVLGRDALNLVASRVPDGSARVHIIPNWADTDEVSPSAATDNPLLHALQLQDRFVLGYAGNMGRVHDIEMLIDAARHLQIEVPDAHVLFVGNGAKDSVIKSATKANVGNVTLVGPMDRSEQSVFLNACHVAIMAFTPGMAGVGVPSRLYNVLAAGRPLVAAVDAESEPALVIREEDVGVQVPPGDARAFADAVKRMRSDPSYLEAAGARARRAAIERFGFPKVLAAYTELLGGWNWPSTAACPESPQ